MPHQGVEQRVAALLEQESSIKQWLNQIGALGRDHLGHIVVRGLSVDEAEEFLRLRPLVQAPDSGLTNSGIGWRSAMPRARSRTRRRCRRTPLPASARGAATERLSARPQRR